VVGQVLGNSLSKDWVMAAVDASEHSDSATCY
jgi:hypothetical protein